MTDIADSSGSNTGHIVQISGPLVKARGLEEAKMYEVVKVGHEELLGEIIELSGKTASIQVYEETSGLAPGAPVKRTGATMSIELGPGLLESIYDGIQRPLSEIEAQSKTFTIARGIKADGLNRQKLWDFEPNVKEGQEVESGDILGKVQETELIDHFIMVPPEITGTVIKITKGQFTVEDTVAVIKTKNDQEIKVGLMTKWPIRQPRPTKGKIFPVQPLISGVRVIDTFFPIVKGGAGSIPGPFGSGKTITQQALAKYCDAQIIIYIGCGERGNEMTEVLNEFPHLTDPNTGHPLIRRTVMIANTSNMPVAAREASVYTGISIAEYYRDMGYSVALMADSTSRWAEAMREIAGRLEEMPGEEGYPAYLASRTAQFYERAGLVNCLGKDDRQGALTVIGAVSPPGGDLSEPVSQATLRVTKCFWGLSAELAYKKHFPAIDWLNSYSLYIDNITPWWRENIAEDFASWRLKALNLLQREDELLKIVRLVGLEGLSNEERLALEIAKAIREDFLFQNAFDQEDAFTHLGRQYQILRSILTIYDITKPLTEQENFDFNKWQNSEAVQQISNLRIGEWTNSDYENWRAKAKSQIDNLFTV